MVGDCALYSAANIALMKNIKWLSRVPLTLEKAKNLVSQLEEAEFTKSEIEGYSYVERKSNYGGVEQRWLIVESKARKISEQRKITLYFLPDSTVFITPINQLQKQILSAMKMPELLYELELKLCKT
jgi:hypothetical protein